MRVGQRRSRQRGNRQSDHPTRGIIIAAAADILKTGGVAQFHVDDVLAATGLTRGAVYHHFDGVEDLIEAALLATYAEGISANVALISELMATVDTFEGFCNGVLAANVAYAQNESLRAVRALRAHAMAMTVSASAMAAQLAAEQQRLTDAYVSMITQAQQRGWVKQSLKPDALAVFIQAYSFGAIIDDVSAEHIGAEAWAEIIADFFVNCVFDATADPA